MRWLHWAPRVPPVDRERRDRLNNVLTRVTENLTTMVNDLEKAAQRKLSDES